MVPKEAKMVLDYIVSKYKDQGQKNEHELDNIDEIFPYPVNEEIPEILELLEQEGYLHCQRYVDGQYRVKLTYKGLNSEDFPDEPSPQPIININGNVKNSAFGNTGNTTLNLDTSYSHIRSQIKEKHLSKTDEEKALAILDYTKSLTDEDIPIKKGVFKRFGEFMKQNSWLPNLLSSVIMKHLMG